MFTVRHVLFCMLIAARTLDLVCFVCNVLSLNFLIFSKPSHADIKMSFIKPCPNVSVLLFCCFLVQAMLPEGFPFHQLNFTCESSVNWRKTTLKSYVTPRKLLKKSILENFIFLYQWSLNKAWQLNIIALLLQLLPEFKSKPGA